MLQGKENVLSLNCKIRALQMDLNLSGKRAIVCGSTQGIGKAIALELAEMGASITLVARNESALKTVLTELSASKGQNHDFVCADFTKPMELKSAIEQRFQSGKESAHILVNNTGGPPGGPIVSAHSDEFVNTFSSHFPYGRISLGSHLGDVPPLFSGRLDSQLSI